MFYILKQKGQQHPCLNRQGGTAMKTTSIGKRVNPERYGMIFCPSCNGFGKSFADAKGVNVCKVCGGFGAIKKEDKNRFNDKRVRVKAEFIT
jgi:hypothetical protein